MRRKICIIYIMVFALIISACAKVETAEEAVTNALTALRDVDMETIQKYFGTEDIFADEDEDYLATNKYAKLILGNLDFEILSSSETKEGAVVEVEISNIDMEAIMSEFFVNSLVFAFDESLTEEEYDKKSDELMVSLLSRKENLVKTSVIRLNLTKTEKDWLIEANKELLDAALGGLYSFIDSFNENQEN